MQSKKVLKFSHTLMHSYYINFYSLNIFPGILKDFNAVNAFFKLLLINIDFTVTSYFKVNVLLFIRL